VRFADICNYGNIWFCDFGKGFYLPKMIHSHFKNSHVVGVVKFQHGFWKPNLVVVVFIGKENAEFCRKNRRYHVFGGGFSVASGNRNNRNFKKSPVISRQLLKGGKGVLYF